MPKIVRENIDNVNAVLTLDITKEEYSSVWKDKMKEHRQKMQVKGFRKGKTPMGYLKKMYGKQIMMDVVNEILQSEIPKYLEAEKLNLLGQPLAHADSDAMDFNIDNPTDLSFKFDLGLAPEFKLKGADKKTSYNYYDVTLEDKVLTEELERMTKQLGDRETLTEGKLEDNDVVKLKLQELKGRSINEEGVENEVSVFVGKLTDAAQKSLLKKKVGESLNIDIFDFEKDESEANVRKHLLGLEEADAREINNKFKATIVESVRLTEAELNEETFEKAFPGKEIKDEAGAKEEIGKSLKGHFNQQADVMFFNNFREQILEKNTLEFPETFLKRWMKETNNEMADADIEAQFPNYMESIRWTTIKNALMQAMDVKVEQADMIAAAKKQALQYFGGNVEDAMLENIVEYILKDEKESHRLHEEASTNALVVAVKDKVKVVSKNITSEKFVEEIKKYNEKHQAKQAEEHVHDENCGHDH